MFLVALGFELKGAVLDVKVLTEAAGEAIQHRTGSALGDWRLLYDIVEKD